jgi:hypothetical protein
MSTAPKSEHPPIYDQLVSELGDVVAETRQAAEQTQAQLKTALDFSGIRRAHQDREERAFSAFGRTGRDSAPAAG